MPANPIWSMAARDPVGGLLYAREAERLGFFAAGRLAWLDRGAVDVQTAWESPVVLAAVSEDASVAVAVGADQRLRFLSPTLRTLWDREWIDRPLALAVDPLGLFVAVGDGKSLVTLIDREGKTFAQVKCPRPVVRLAFLPTRGLLVCVGDIGWLGAYDLGKRDWAWRGTLFFNAAYLAVSGADSPILVGGFADSLAAFDANGGRYEWPFAPPPAREAQFAADGSRLFVLARDGTLRGYTLDGKELPGFEPRPGVLHFRVGGFGDRVFVATADGRLQWW